MRPLFRFSFILLALAAMAPAERAPRREYSFSAGRKRFLKLDAMDHSRRRALLGSPYTMKFQVSPLIYYLETPERPLICVSVYDPDGKRTRQWVTPGADGAYDFTFLPKLAGKHHFTFESWSSRWVIAKVPAWSVSVLPGESAP